MEFGEFPFFLLPLLPFFFILSPPGGVSVTHAYEWTTFVVRSEAAAAAAVCHDGRRRGSSRESRCCSF